MKNIKMYLIAMLLLITLLPISSAEISVSDFVKVSDFPEYSSGSIAFVEADYSFSVEYATALQVNFTLIQEKLNDTGEWDITFIMDGAVMNDSEMHPGVFISDEVNASIGTHTLKVIADAKPNVIPATYEYVVTLLSENIVIIPDDDKDDKKSSRSNPGNWTITGPVSLGTLAPTPAPTPVPTVIVHQVIDDNGTITVIQSLPDGLNYFWYTLAALLLLIIIILYLYWKRMSTHEV